MFTGSVGKSGAAREWRRRKAEQGVFCGGEGGHFGKGGEGSDDRILSVEDRNTGK